MSDNITASTIARIAGNILSGCYPAKTTAEDDELVAWAVSMARKVVDEVRRTEPTAATAGYRAGGSS